MIRSTSHDSKSLISSALKHVPKAKQSALRKFAKLLFDNASPEDIAGQSPQTLAKLIETGEEALSKPKLSVEQLGDDQTLITVSQTNRPFITDSIIAELSAHPINIELVVHPVIDGMSLVLVIISQSRCGNQKNDKGKP